MAVLACIIAEPYFWIILYAIFQTAGLLVALIVVQALVMLPIWRIRRRRSAPKPREDQSD